MLNVAQISITSPDITIQFGFDVSVIEYTCDQAPMLKITFHSSIHSIFRGMGSDDLALRGIPRNGPERHHEYPILASLVGALHLWHSDSICFDLYGGASVLRMANVALVK